jgi:hypothetical protein
MINDAIIIDDQPISANFFGAGSWLTSYITPESPDVKMLYNQITAGAISAEDKTTACWDWVANEVKYRSFIKATINIEGKSSRQDDYWQMPNLCIHTQIGNCANKAFLLTSLLRNHIDSEHVYCVLGNLYNGHASGHAWVEAIENGADVIIEATRGDVPIVPARQATRYEAIHYFNDKKVLMVPGKTELRPIEACYSTWLHDYLYWGYIEEAK